MMTYWTLIWVHQVYFCCNPGEYWWKSAQSSFPPSEKLTHSEKFSCKRQCV